MVRNSKSEEKESIGQLNLNFHVDDGDLDNVGAHGWFHGAYVRDYVFYLMKLHLYDHVYDVHRCVNDDDCGLKPYVYACGHA